MTTSPDAPTPPESADRDAEHVRLLAIFHYILGGILLILAFCPSLHLIIGLVVLFGGEEVFNGEQASSMSGEDRFIFGLMFTVMPLAFMVLGWVLGGIQIAAGRCLQRRRRWLFCMIAAGLACLFMPLGTVLGVFTIIVLNRDAVRAKFDWPTTAQAGA